MFNKKKIGGYKCLHNTRKRTKGKEESNICAVCLHRHVIDDP